MSLVFILFSLHDWYSWKRIVLEYYCMKYFYPLRFRNSEYSICQTFRFFRSNFCFKHYFQYAGFLYGYFGIKPIWRLIITNFWVIILLGHFPKHYIYNTLWDFCVVDVFFFYFYILLIFIKTSCKFM